VRVRYVVGLVVLAGILVATGASGTMDATDSNLPPRLGASRGAQYFVDGTGGSDANPGTRRRPWKTIARAWRSVPPKGSVINVRAGTYTQETILKGRTSTAADPITLRAYPGEVVTLGNASGDGAAVYIEDVVGLRVQGFRVTNPRSDGIKVTNSADVELVRNTITGNGNQGILVVGDGSGRMTYSRNVQLWRNRIFANGALGDAQYNHGVYYGATGQEGPGLRHGTVGGVIANNLFYDQPTGFHLQVGPQAEGLIVTNNTFAMATSGDPRSGSSVVVWGEGDRYSTNHVLVVNNVFVFNAQAGIRGAGVTTTSNVVRANFGYSNPLGSFVPGLGANAMFVVGENVHGPDPRFVDREAKDFRPSAGSPLIGRADPAFAPPLDATGLPRDKKPDIGALEYLPATRHQARR
jgi:parallel beta-helix repeat protein